MPQLRIGVIGAGLRSSIAKYWHNPKGDSVVTGVADISFLCIYGWCFY